MTDPIGDLLTRIRNALQAGHLKVDVGYSRIKADIVRLLREEGYINNYKVTGEGHRRTIRIYLKYTQSSEPVSSTSREFLDPVGGYMLV